MENAEKKATDRARALLMHRFDMLNNRLEKPGAGASVEGVAEGNFTVSAYTKGIAEIAEALAIVRKIDNGA